MKTFVHPAGKDVSFPAELVNLALVQSLSRVSNFIIFNFAGNNTTASIVWKFKTEHLASEYHDAIVKYHSTQILLPYE